MDSQIYGYGSLFLTVTPGKTMQIMAHNTDALRTAATVTTQGSQAEALTFFYRCIE